MSANYIFFYKLIKNIFFLFVLKHPNLPSLAQSQQQQPPGEQKFTLFFEIFYLW